MEPHPDPSPDLPKSDTGSLLPPPTSPLPSPLPVTETRTLPVPASVRLPPPVPLPETPSVSVWTAAARLAQKLLVPTRTNQWAALTAISAQASETTPEIALYLGEHILGRGVAAAESRLSAAAVSSLHCRIVRRQRTGDVTGEKYDTWIADSSANGTWVNREKLPRDGPEKILKHGDVLSLVAPPDARFLSHPFLNRPLADVALSYVYREVAANSGSVASSEGRRDPEVREQHLSGIERGKRKLNEGGILEGGPMGGEQLQAGEGEDSAKRMRGLKKCSVQDLGQERGEGLEEVRGEAGVSEMAVLRVKLEEAERVRAEAEATIQRIHEAIAELQHRHEDHHGLTISMELPIQSPLQLSIPVQRHKLQSTMPSTSPKTNIKEEGEEESQTKPLEDFTDGALLLLKENSPFLRDFCLNNSRMIVV